MAAVIFHGSHRCTMKHKNRRIILFASFAFSLLFVSCDPLGVVSQKARDPLSMSRQIVVHPGDDTAEVKWAAVFGADSYSIQYRKTSDRSAGSSIEIHVSDLIASGNYQEGWFSYELTGLSWMTDYTLSLIVNGNGLDSVTCDPVEFTTRGSDKVPELAPIAYVASSDVSLGSVNVVINPLDNVLAYVIEAVPDSNAAQPTSENLEFDTVPDMPISCPLRGLSTDTSYSITIWAASRLENGTPPVKGLQYRTLPFEWDRGASPAPEIAEVKAFSNHVAVSLQSGIAVPVVLYRKDTPDGLFETVCTVSSEEPLIDTTVEPGHIYYYAVGSEGSMLSSVRQVVVPVALTPVSYADRIDLSWPTVENARRYFLTVGSQKEGSSYTKQIPESSIQRTTQGKSTYTVGADSPLISKNAYTFELLVEDQYGIRFNGTISTETSSWAGRYRWYRSGNKGVDTFVVQVKDTEAIPEASGTLYPYYIYADPSDPAYTGEAYRIMPIIDTTLPDGLALMNQTHEYNGAKPYERAYKWNAGKWNPSKFTPRTWKLVSVPTADALLRNYFGSEVETQVEKPFPLSVITATTFEFRTVDDDSVLLFTNKAVNNNMVNGFLVKNENPDTMLGEKDKYTFALEKVE